VGLIVRIGALAAIVGGALVAIGHLANLAGEDRSGTVMGQTLVLAAHVLLVLALIAIAVRAAGDILIVFGATLAAAGTSLVTAVVVVDLLAAEGVLDRQRFVESTAGPVDVIAPVLFVAGIVLIGIGALKSSLPTGAGVALLVGGVLEVLGIAVPVASVAGAVVLAVGFVWLGMDMLMPARTGPEGTA